MRQLRCPKCKGSKLIPIVYGYPSPEMEEKSIQGKIKLGGCCVGSIFQLGALAPDESGLWGDQPNWHCKNCKRNWTDSELEQGKTGARGFHGPGIKVCNTRGASGRCHAKPRV